MKILYQIPSLENVYAIRFIYEGYKCAFTELKHEFKPYTSEDNLKETLDTYKPDILITSLNRYNLKYLDLNLLKKYREKGLVVFTQVPSWKKQNNQFGGGNLKEDKKLVDLVKKGYAGDIFFHWLEQDDPSMNGFTKVTGYPFYTVLLAADTKRFFYEYDPKYKCDISFVGSFLPDKREIFKEYLLPLKNKYNVKIYGSDWTTTDRFLGIVQKAGQYFNINPLKHVRQLKLPLSDERKVYSSSLVSLNLHERHQRVYGSDFNERTLKIIASGGFEICDNVKVLRKYFSEKELVIAENKRDWFEKIDYYIKNPDKRIPIIKASMKKVLKEHTYYNRVNQFISIYEAFKKEK